MSVIPFDELAARFSLPPAASAWATDWEVSQASYPESGPDFLSAASVQAACALLELSAELRQALLDGLPAVRASAPLCRLAWHLHCRLYAHGVLNDTVREWPLLPPGSTGDHDLFFAYLLLAGVPRLAAFYRDRDIPLAVLQATLADVELWIRDYRGSSGRWGLRNVRWLTNHLSGGLFQLARLQFQFGTSRYPYHAWRCRSTGRVQLLADSAVRFAADGRAAGSDASLPLNAPYEVTAQTVSGLPIDPRGHAVPTPAALPRGDWTPILDPGDPVLNLHIPAGRPLDYNDCGESFRLANHFFATHFPEARVAAYVCGSWLLDPQLETALSPQSNLVRFLREVYLFPLPGATGRQTFERVFGTAEVNPATAARDTSLRRAILAHVECGGAWRAGGCVLFPAEVPSWGRQIYRADG